MQQKKKKKKTAKAEVRCSEKNMSVSFSEKEKKFMEEKFFRD